MRFKSSKLLWAVVSLLISISSGVIHAAAPSITNLALVPRLTIQSDLGMTNQIQYSTNLTQTNWTVLTNIVVTQSPYWFVDVGTPANNQRFYRVLGFSNNVASATTSTITAPTTVTSGFNITVTLQAKNSSGNNLTAGGSVVVFSVQAGTGSASIGATTDHGDGTYTALLTGILAGTVTVNATLNGSNVTSTAGVTVNPGAANKLAFGQNPTSATGGSTMTPAVTVRVQDAAGNSVASSVSITIAIGSNAGGGTLSGTANQSAVSGVATFSGLSIDKVGVYTLSAASSGLTSATSATFNISAGPASKLAFVQQPGNTTHNVTISPAVTVQIQDAGGNVVFSSSTVTIAIGTNPSSGTLSGTTSVAASSGLATFNSLSINNVGTGYTLTTSSSGLTGATSIGFNIQ